jgi:hypothetical protein
MGINRLEGLRIHIYCLGIGGFARKMKFLNVIVTLNLLSVIDYKFINTKSDVFCVTYLYIMMF